MQTEIHIARQEDGNFSIIEDREIKQSGKETLIRQRRYEYDEYGECYPLDEWIPVEIEESFSVITTAAFIRNPRDKSALNARTTRTGGFGTSHLMYSYSVAIIKNHESGNIYESDCVYSESGIRPTDFSMYSYHVNEPEQRYIEDRIEYEAYEKIDFDKALWQALAKYLTKSDLRDAVLKNIGI